VQSVLRVERKSSQLQDHCVFSGYTGLGFGSAQYVPSIFVECSLSPCFGNERMQFMMFEYNLMQSPSMRVLEFVISLYSEDIYFVFRKRMADTWICMSYTISSSTPRPLLVVRSDVLFYISNFFHYWFFMS